MAENSVFFAIPCYKHGYASEFLWSFVDTVQLLNEKNYSWAAQEIKGDPFVDRARCRLGTNFLDFSFENIFFIDDDLGWPAKKVLEFIERPEPVICGAAPVKELNLRFPVELQIDSAGKCIENNGLLKTADKVPSGFLRIKRWVLEKLINSGNIGKFFTDDGTDTKIYHHLFKSGPEISGGPYLCEDYYFSIKCSEMGIDMWVDPDVELSHRGSSLWKAKLIDSLSVVS